MEQSNLEKNIRIKFNERTIIPSEDLWKKLDNKLDENQTKKSFNLWYYAASLLLFFSVGYFYFKNENTTTTIKSIDVVHSNSIKNSFKTKGTPTALPLEIVNHSVKSNKTANFKNDIVLVSDSVLIAHSEPKLDSVISKPNKLDIAIVNPTENSEALKGKIVINAQTLLDEVENQIKNEYRENTIAKINRNYKVIKTAIVNRNYE